MESAFKVYKNSEKPRFLKVVMGIDIQRIQSKRTGSENI